MVQFGFEQSVVVQLGSIGFNWVVIVVRVTNNMAT